MLYNGMRFKNLVLNDPKIGSLTDELLLFFALFQTAVFMSNANANGAKVWRRALLFGSKKSLMWGRASFFKLLQKINFEEFYTLVARKPESVRNERGLPIYGIFPSLA